MKNTILFIFIVLFSWKLLATHNDFYANYGDYFTVTAKKYFLLDPYVKFNRTIFNWNYKIDEILIDHAIDIYKSDHPKWSKELLINFTRNFNEPVNMVNYLLQKNLRGFAKSLWSFLLNSTVGAFGLFNISEAFGMEYERNGFDRTLALYGVKPGAHIVLPWYGSFSSRSIIASFADFIFNPLLFVFPVSVLRWEWMCYSSFLKSNSLAVGVHLTSLSLDQYDSWKRVFTQTQQYNNFKKGN